MNLAKLTALLFLTSFLAGTQIGASLISVIAISSGSAVATFRSSPFAEEHNVARTLP